MRHISPRQAQTTKNDNSRSARAPRKINKLLRAFVLFLLAYVMLMRVRALDSAKENTSHSNLSPGVLARSTKKRVVLLSLLFE
jgi:hypothetical protein